MNIQDVINAWNAQAGEHARWHELWGDEKVEFTLKLIQSQLDEFLPMLDQWRTGKPVVKICYALSNDHMKTLDKIIPRV